MAEVRGGEGALKDGDLEPVLGPWGSLKGQEGNLRGAGDWGGPPGPEPPGDP